MLKFLPKLRSVTSRVAGFTMIELLIVITILGILATAVLSAINPIEQINRGRDTSSTSDSEQMINAIERYNALQGFFPWVVSQNSSFAISTLLTIANTWTDGTCPVLEKLGSASTPGCTGANELKSSFMSRITNAAARKMFIYNKGGTGDSTYVCFIPQSDAFKQKARTRCTVAGGDLPADIPTDVRNVLCADKSEYVCLP